MAGGFGSKESGRSPLDEMCRGATETGNWPCGREAAYALSRLIDQRGLECTVETDTRGDTEAVCKRGDVDVALEMLRRGLGADRPRRHPGGGPIRGPRGRGGAYGARTPGVGTASR